MGRGVHETRSARGIRGGGGRAAARQGVRGGRSAAAAAACGRACACGRAATRLRPAAALPPAALRPIWRSAASRQAGEVVKAALSCDDDASGSAGAAPARAAPATRRRGAARPAAGAHAVPAPATARRCGRCRALLIVVGAFERAHSVAAGLLGGAEARGDRGGRRKGGGRCRRKVSAPGGRRRRRRRGETEGAWAGARPMCAERARAAAAAR